ncbi:hypothetical protein [Polymorphobacter sp. PAMC 29334]|nr:hypothetical protein [Polymorphobacter sp. PAMC 29334]
MNASSGHRLPAYCGVVAAVPGVVELLGDIEPWLIPVDDRRL